MLPGHFKKLKYEIVLGGPMNYDKMQNPSSTQQDNFIFDTADPVFTQMTAMRGQ